MVLGAATYLAIIIFIIYSIATLKTKIFTLDSVIISKNKGILLFQIIKGLSLLLLVITYWGYTYYGVRILTILFLISLWGDIYYRNQAIKSSQNFTKEEKYKLLSSAKKLYYYAIPYIIIYTLVVFY